MTAPHKARRRTLVTAAKIALAVAILAYLIIQAQAHEGFTRLVEQPKRWPLLAAALACTFTAVVLSFVRWHLLIGALGITIRLTDTLRLGALGYALNFVSLGTLGGDLFKAIFLAHGRPGRRAEAVVSVVADRFLGLLTTLVLASGGILATDLAVKAPDSLAMLCHSILVVTFIGLVGAGAVLLIPGLSGPRLCGWALGVPLVGASIARLLGAVQAYRHQKRLLLAAAGLSVGVGILSITSVFLVACGLPVHRPTWAEHLVLVSVANMAGAIPATPSGLGTMEAATEMLYQTMPSSEGVLPGDGTMVMLASRAMAMAAALVGLLYYLSYWAETREAYAEAEELIEMN